MGTFRKFFFVLYSRRPRVRLLVKPEMIGIIDRRILSYSPTVKEKNAEKCLWKVLVSKSKLRICI
jgi:hypothetical protein